MILWPAPDLISLNSRRLHTAQPSPMKPVPARNIVIGSSVGAQGAVGVNLVFSLSGPHVALAHPATATTWIAIVSSAPFS
jgi:hypothetical protein